MARHTHHTLHRLHAAPSSPWESWLIILGASVLLVATATQISTHSPQAGDELMGLLPHVGFLSLGIFVSAYVLGGRTSWQRLRNWLVR